MRRAANRLDTDCSRKMYRAAQNPPHCVPFGTFVIALTLWLATVAVEMTASQGRPPQGASLERVWCNALLARAGAIFAAFFTILRTALPCPEMMQIGTCQPTIGGRRHQGGPVG